MIKQIVFGTGNHLTGLFARLTMGVVMLPHGLQKTFGLFGGYGFDSTLSYFTGTMHLPVLLSVFIIFAEFIGALALIAGIAVRFWSLVMLLLMAGAVVMVHAPNGFFMNWDGSAAGEGFEYHLLAAGLCLVSLINGAGRYSVDRWIAGSPRSSTQNLR